MKKAFYMFFLLISIGDNFIFAKYFDGGVHEDVKFSVQRTDKDNTFMTRLGSLVYYPDAPATILICHGFMCNKNEVGFLRFLFQGYNTFMFDFRAHGSSKKSGVCCSFGKDEAEDVIGAVKFIKSHPFLKSKPLIVYGFSMGAVASLAAQAREKNLFDCAIWDCPFDSTDKIISRSLRCLKFTFFGYEIPLPCRNILRYYAYNQYVQNLIKSLLKVIAKVDTSYVETCMKPIAPYELASSITIPALFIVGEKDDKAPPKAVKKIYNNVQGHKRIWITEAGHFGSFFAHPEHYRYKVRRFIEKFLNRTYLTKEKQKIKKMFKT